ncbi:ribonucleoside-triphosphate reductase, adenosylcobalamin-dependent [Spirillospora sp. NPDC047279]|uniref:ribonucleoside-triphosphate reductase, adenosylcobalamin-dependent n=1 Tax=Spirillospora sp. NPDC047279 TaxID=3155478 RepID=UPI003404C64E
MNNAIAWGPSGKDVYDRTYSRTKPNGQKETWPETVRRVTKGNLALVSEDQVDDGEAADLGFLMEDFAILPAGRHLWASGVKGRQFLFNCWHSGWGPEISSHFRFTFMRLMEGGGVGATYSTEKTSKYGPIQRPIEVHIVCDETHPDHDAMKAAGLLSGYFDPDYQGSFCEVEDSREGWADALTDLLESAWDPAAHPVRVYDVSRVRASGARLKTFGGFASGPQPLAKMLKEIEEVLDDLAVTTGLDDRFGVPLDPISAMEIEHAIAQCVVAGGNRRSARMSIMPWNDPQVDEFIRLKEDTGSHWTTNISVQIDDEFNAALGDDDPTALSVLQAISEGMLKNGEPGVWNKSFSNVGEVHEVSSTNPCGEIPLPEWGACVLGHVNLEAFAPKALGEDFDLDGAVKAAKIMTRFLIRATFGDILDDNSRHVMDRDRRIGVGLFGVQAAFARMGVSYAEIADNWQVKHILWALKSAVREEARTYSFRLRIPEPIKVTTIAPTGSIAKLPGTTEGIHPIFSRYFIRRIRFSTLDEAQVARLEEFKEQGFVVEPCQYAANTMVVEIPTKERLVDDVVALGHPPSIVQSADELTLTQMLAVQDTVQCWYADNAVSFTANIDPTKYTVEELAGVLKDFAGRLKGSTIFPDQSRPQSPYERISEADFNLYQMTQIGEGVDEECATGSCPVR